MPDSTLPEGLPDRTLGWGVLKWCSKYLRQPDGANAGEPWRFTTTQVRFVLWFYAVDVDGRYTYHRGVLRWAKGAGKSPMVAAMALCEFLGPVRFSHMDGSEPVGVPVAMPWVQIAATAESQTVNTMSMVTAMAPKGSRLAREYKLDVGKEKIYRPGGGRLEIITASAHAAEGARATFAIADETEWWLSSNGGHALDGVIRRNLAKTGGRLIETCNAFVPGQESVSERSHDAWQAQQEGRLKKGGILYDAREAPPGTDPADEDSLRDGLAVAYADAPWVDLDRIVAEYYDPSTGPDVARRFYLNQIVAAEDAWVSPAEFAACADPTVTVKDDEPIVMFFDGSKSRDATGLVGCRMSDGHIFTIGCWEPSGRGDEVPVGEIDATVQRAFDRWDVQAFFADVHEWEGFTKVTWPERYRERLLLWATPSSREPQPVAWDMRSKVYDFTMAAETTFSEIVERQFTHDGDPALTRHVGNSRRRLGRWGVSISKETKDSPRKIDLAVCLIGARMVRRLVLASPEWQKRDEGGGGSRVWGF